MKMVLCAVNSKFVHSSLAVWYLAAAIENDSKTNQCVVVEGTINEDEELLYKRISECSPDVVGLSTYIWNRKTVFSLAEKLKGNLGCKIILGGPEVSYNAEEILKRYDFVDYIISGEGEEPLVKLCNKEEIDTIEGLCYKKSGDVFVKPPFVSGKEPPNPYTEKYFQSLNGRIAYIETSRGCPFSCAFCLSGRCGGVRFFNVEQAKKNIVLLANSGTQTVKFIDRTFNADRKRAREIFSFIINEKVEGRIPNEVCFHFEIEGELLDNDTIELLRTAPVGLIQFEIGLQSFNGDTLNAINRKTNLERLCQNIKRIIELKNIHTHIDLIVGLPYEGYESFKDSFNNAYALKPHMLQVGFLKLLHGAELRENEGYQWDFIDTPPYEIKSTPWISREEVDFLHSFEDVFEKMYNSSRFGLTCEYFEGMFDSPFDMYASFTEYVENTPHENSLDSFTKLIFDYFVACDGVDEEILRDKLAIDRLATNKMGALPEFLKVKCPKMKQYLNELEQNEQTRCKKGIKRAATVLLSENKLAYVDYDQADYLTNRFLVKLTEI